MVHKWVTDPLISIVSKLWRMSIVNSSQHFLVEAITSRLEAITTSSKKLPGWRSHWKIFATLAHRRLGVLLRLGQASFCLQALTTPEAQLKHDWRRANSAPVKGLMVDIPQQGKSAR